MSIFSILGILSAIIFIIGDIPYFKDAIKGPTKPHRVTWGIIFLVNIIGIANQYASGATDSIWLFWAATIATGSIFFASIFRGVGGHTKYDIIALILSLLGIVAWVIISNPLGSVIANILVSIIAVSPTIKKSKKDPKSETRIAYLLGTISSLLALISVNAWEINLLLPHIFGVIIQAYLVYLLYILPKKNKA